MYILQEPIEELLKKEKHIRFGELWQKRARKIYKSIVGSLRGDFANSLCGSLDNLLFEGKIAVMCNKEHADPLDYCNDCEIYLYE